MSNTIKNQRAILDKLGIKELNEMQNQAKFAIHSNPNVVLLSPTGTGKTLAFLLPIIEELDENSEHIQALILVPSRELAIQIEQVAREMGTGNKINAFYGGQSFSKDRQELETPPAILIGTPGRIADHLRRETFEVVGISALVLDEFDKSLEIGFEADMSEIIEALPNVRKKILTSATKGIEIPVFVGLNKEKVVNFLDIDKPELTIKTVISPEKDKLDTLVALLNQIGEKQGLVFCNFKDSIQRVSDFLNYHNIPHGCFYGGLEQNDRENALIKFRNGTHRLLIATDLAARGIDVPEMDFIIHYHLPLKAEEFTHRNGRTARMHSDGIAYVLKWSDEDLPDFIQPDGVEELSISNPPTKTEWKTLYISGGRRDKISKGDIAGFFFKEGKLKKGELGDIELKQESAFAAVKADKVDQVLKLIDNKKLKTKKVRITVI
ncbi:MAG: DEAD/DEAH box helicase [Balneola sp.]